MPTKYLVLFSEHIPERTYYIAAVVEGDTLRKAQAATRKVFPNARFGGMFSPRLVKTTDKAAALYARPADTRLSRYAVHCHRAALEVLP